MKTNKRVKLIIFLFIILFLIDICFRTLYTPIYKSSEEKKLSGLFQGTFITEDEPSCYITVDGGAKKFFYFDDLQRVYFEGTFSEIGSEYYQLNSEYFGSQIIHYNDLCFDLSLNGKIYFFKKYSNNEMYGRVLDESGSD